MQYSKSWLRISIGKVYRLCAKFLRFFRIVFRPYSDFDPNIEIGRHTYGVNKHTIFLASSLDAPCVTIGSFCSIAQGVVILANADHPTHLPSTFPFRTRLYPIREKKKLTGYKNVDVVSRGPVNIGHDVWIGQNVLILSGVVIGTGAIVGAGSLVAKDIPPYAIAVGNPAKVIRFRFSPDVIERLLKSEWWTLSDDDIFELEPFLYDFDINGFVRQVALMKSDKSPN